MNDPIQISDAELLELPMELVNQLRYRFRKRWSELRLQRPQPYYDFELAKICAWLREHGYTMHVTIKGEITLRKKDK